MLLPYTYPTPKLSPHRRRLHLYFPQKTHSVWFISFLNYGDTENVLINHLLLVIPMSYHVIIQICVLINHINMPTHTHTHTHTHTTHTHKHLEMHQSDGASQPTQVNHTLCIPLCVVYLVQVFILYYSVVFVCIFCYTYLFYCVQYHAALFCPSCNFLCNIWQFVLLLQFII